MGQLKVAIIGLDTTHVSAYIDLLNNDRNPFHIPGARAVTAWAGGSPDWALSRRLLKKFGPIARHKYGLRIHSNIEEALYGMDAAMVLSIDGRVHWDQFKPIARRGIPVYINKPLTCDLREARKLAALSRKTKTPVFSASSLRYSPSIQGYAQRSGKDRILSAHASGPATHETGHPGLFWYGIHSAEVLFTLLGRGVESVMGLGSPRSDLVAAQWKGDRTGILSGYRDGSEKFTYSIQRGEKTIGGEVMVNARTNAALMRSVVHFFRTGISPVALHETLEIIAFLESANRSIRTGREVKVERP
jgi:hypothetical protein